ncbi:MAG TPA: FecR domain-containing protein [Planctomycetota bacterium]|nr:FecR domain-containing protein [Planctomycetota bacterium]
MSTPCEEIRPELEDLLGRMAEEQLDSERAKRLSQILKEHPDARQFYFDYCQMHALLQSAHGVLQALENPAIRRRRILAGFSAAAATLIVAGIALLARGPRPIDAAVSALQGPAFVVRDDRKLPLADLRELRAGDRIVTPADATSELRYGDGSRVVLLEKTEIRLRDDGRARLELRDGAVRCDVPPQAPGQPFGILTPHAEATVLGTSFELWASSEETRLRTRSGRVRLSSEGHSVEVGPGERGSATGSGVVRWVPVRDFDFTTMTSMPSTLETLFCESATLVRKDRKPEAAPDRVRFVEGGLTFVQGSELHTKHGLVVLKDKEETGNDVILEAVVPGGQRWSLGLTVSGDAFEGYRIIFAAMDEYPNGVAVDTISAFELMVLARDPRKISYDQDHTLQVERRGSRVRVWIDDQTRIDTEVTQPLPEGRFRTYSMSNFGAPPKVKYLKVWKPAP